MLTWNAFVSNLFFFFRIISYYYGQIFILGKCLQFANFRNHSTWKQNAISSFHLIWMNMLFLFYSTLEYFHLTVEDEKLMIFNFVWAFSLDSFDESIALKSKLNYIRKMYGIKKNKMINTHTSARYMNSTSGTQFVDMFGTLSIARNKCYICIGDIL